MENVRSCNDPLLSLAVFEWFLRFQLTLFHPKTTQMFFFKKMNFVIWFKLKLWSYQLISVPQKMKVERAPFFLNSFFFTLNGKCQNVKRKRHRNKHVPPRASQSGREALRWALTCPLPQLLPVSAGSPLFCAGSHSTPSRGSDNISFNFVWIFCLFLVCQRCASSTGGNPEYGVLKGKYGVCCVQGRQERRLIERLAELGWDELYWMTDSERMKCRRQVIYIQVWGEGAWLTGRVARSITCLP